MLILSNSQPGPYRLGYSIVDWGGGSVLELQFYLGQNTARLCMGLLTCTTNLHEIHSTIWIKMGSDKAFQKCYYLLSGKAIFRKLFFLLSLSCGTPHHSCTVSLFRWNSSLCVRWQGGAEGNYRKNQDKHIVT